MKELLTEGTYTMLRCLQGFKTITGGLREPIELLDIKAWREPVYLPKGTLLIALIPREAVRTEAEWVEIVRQLILEGPIRNPLPPEPPPVPGFPKKPGYTSLGKKECE